MVASTSTSSNCFTAILIKRNAIEVNFIICSVPRRQLAFLRIKAIGMKTQIGIYLLIVLIVNICWTKACIDLEEDCPQRATQGECTKNVNLLIVCPKSCGVCAFHSKERMLKDYLFNNYDKDIRPVLNTSSVTKIEINLNILHIKELNLDTQTLVLEAWLSMQWMDHFLIWNQSDFSELSELRMPPEFVWKPDIYLYNGADSNTMKIHSDALVLIFSTGSILWVPPLTISSYCEADLRYFPFDEHLCILKFGSWTHDGTMIQLKLLHNDKFYNETIAISQNDFMNNNEWDLISTTGKINSRKYPCCPEKYEDASFTLHIKRKSHYYGCTLVVGNLVAALVTICIFLMPPEKSKRIILGVINLVIVVLLILFLASHIPPSKSNIPIVVVCPTVIAVLTLIALVVSTIFLHLTNGSMVMSVPHYLHVFCLDIMGRFLCIRDISSSPPMLIVKIIDDKMCTIDTSLQQKLESVTTGQDMKREVESQNRHHWYTIAVVINRLCLICYIFIMIVIVIALCVGS